MLKQLQRFWVGKSPPRSASSHDRLQLDRLLVEVHRLEVDAEWTDPVTRARLWKEISAAASRAGDEVMAKQALGRALDAYIEGGRYDAAVVLCRRFIERYPTVVRAHCTLALLYVTRRDLGDAVEAIRAYADAARRSGTESVAIARLLLVAKLTVDVDVREAAKQAIQELAAPGVWRTILRYLSERGRFATEHVETLMDPLDLALLNQMQVRAKVMEIGSNPASDEESAPRAEPSRGRAPLPLLEARG